jgi:hypothetical protein
LRINFTAPSTASEAKPNGITIPADADPLYYLPPVDATRTVNLWSRWDLGLYPIRFDQDTTITGWSFVLEELPIDDPAWYGFQARAFIYQANTNKLPHTLVAELGYFNGAQSVGDPTQLFELEANQPVTLTGGQLYWVGSQFVLNSDETGVPIINEELIGPKYRVLGTSRNGDIPDIGFPSNEVFGSLNGYAGFYSLEIDAPGWSPETPAPAVLDGPLWLSLYPVPYVPMVLLKAVAA